MSRYSVIKDMDIEQGDGINVSVWFQGCSHRCIGCHNPQTWDFNNGKEFNDDVIEYVLNLLTKDKNDIGYKNLSILGGEPLEEVNLPMLTKLLKLTKDISNDIKIYLWTGYRLEDKKDLELLKYIDVLIDGRFEIDNKEITRYKGSSNQRVIESPVNYI